MKKRVLAATTKSRSPLLNVAATAAVLLLGMLSLAQAATYTYTRNTSGGPDNWSTATNWNSTPVSAATTTLLFSGTYATTGVTVSTNNNIPGNFTLNALLFGGNAQTGAPSDTFTISGNELDFVSNGATGPQIGRGATTNNLQRINYIINNDINVGTSGTMTFSTISSLSYTLAGSLKGSATIAKTGGSQVTISNGANTWSGDFQAQGGITLVSGTLSATSGVAISSGAEFRVTGRVNTSATISALTGTSILSGNGTVGTVLLASGAALNPGSTGTGNTGILTAASVSQSLGAHLNMEINNTTAGTGADQLITTANGGLSLAGDIKLTIGAGYTPTSSDVLTLILNNGTGAVSGVFSGISVVDTSGTNSYSGAEGTLLTLNSQQFQLTYLGGNGNDVALLAVPEPRTMAILLGGLGMLVLIKSRRRRLDA